jgi:hypothetical protein
LEDGLELTPETIFRLIDLVKCPYAYAFIAHTHSVRNTDLRKGGVGQWHGLKGFSGSTEVFLGAPKKQSLKGVLAELAFTVYENGATDEASSPEAHARLNRTQNTQNTFLSRLSAVLLSLERRCHICSEIDLMTPFSTNIFIPSCAFIS